MTTTPPTPPPALSTANGDSNDAPKPRSGLYWLLATAGAPVVALALAGWASTFPWHLSGVCDATRDPFARQLQGYSTFAFAAAGMSALLGVVAARGWRGWFALLLVVTPVVFAQVWSAALYVPPNCPGPFS